MPVQVFSPGWTPMYGRNPSCLSLHNLHLAVRPRTSLLCFLPLSQPSAHWPGSTSSSFPAQPCRLGLQLHSNWAGQERDGNTRLTTLNHRYLTILFMQYNFISSPSHSCFASWTLIDILIELSYTIINLAGQISQQN